MNQNAQTERYKLLVSHLNSYQRNDCYYSPHAFCSLQILVLPSCLYRTSVMME